MFSSSCYKENCQSKPFAKCDCEWSILFCREHAFEHFAQPSTARHQLIYIIFKPSEAIKQTVIQKLTELKKAIQIFRKESIARTSEVIRNLKIAFGNYINQIYEVDKKCNKIIEGLLNYEEFLDIPTENDIESILKLEPEKVKAEMQGWNLNFPLLDYTDTNAAIIKNCGIPFNPFRSIKDEIESNKLSFFRHATSNFSTINLDNFQISSTANLTIQETIYAYTSTCILPDETYFYCCNTSPCSGLTFLVDKNRNVKQLQSSKVNYYLYPVIYISQNRL